jgi:hypothetical protein
MGRIRLGVVMRPLSLVVLVVASCAYDWTVGPSEAGGGTREAGGGDSSREAGGGDSSREASAEATPEESGECAGLLEQIKVARGRVALLRCGTSPCSQHVFDQCACKVAVVDAQNSTVENLVTLVGDYEKAGCHDPGCSSCGTFSPACLAGYCT